MFVSDYGIKCSETFQSGIVKSSRAIGAPMKTRNDACRQILADLNVHELLVSIEKKTHAGGVSTLVRKTACAYLYQKQEE